MCDSVENFQNALSSPPYARRSVNVCEGDVWEMCEICL